MKKLNYSLLHKSTLHFKSILSYFKFKSPFKNLLLTLGSKEKKVEH